MKSPLLISGLVILVIVLCSQGSPSIMNKDEAFFARRVSQLSNFIDRFNYEEDWNGNATTTKSIETRQKNIQSLFDIDKINQDPTFKNNAYRFIEQVTTLNTAQNISFYDDNWYAETFPTANFNGKRQEIKLVMQNETYEDKSSAWVVVGVKADFINVPKKEKDQKHYISPTDHELNFMNLDEALNERNPVTIYAHNDFEPNSLSVFFYLVQTGQLKINHINKSIYHFLQIPNWVFTVEKLNKPGENSGWRITNLLPMSDKDKQVYKKQFLNLSF